MNIADGGLDDPRVQALLTHHFTTARAQTARGSAHALDLSGLRSPQIRFWSAWEGERVIAIGALKRLSDSHGEVKSMHTEQSSRRRGAGSAMLRHIIAAARGMGLSRLSLETGSWPFFIPARELYRRHGFAECPPFGDYTPDPNSVFMTLELNDTLRPEATMAVDRSAFFWQMQDGKLPIPRCAATLGIVIRKVSPDEGTIECEFEGKPEFANPMGNIQGGFLAAMLDDTMGPALAATLAAGEFAPTLNLNVCFVKPAKPGTLTGLGRIVRRGNEVCHLAGELFQAGELVATATATAFVRRTPK
jgi:putative acetyltransferase